MACSTACHSSGLALPAWAKANNAVFRTRKITPSVASCCFLFMCALLSRSLRPFRGRKNWGVGWDQLRFLVYQPRYFKAESGSPPLRALHAHAATVSCADRFHNREAKAGAAQFTRPGFIGSIKALENVCLAFLRNADPCIGYRQDRLVRLAGHADVDGSAFRSVLDGIVEEVHNHLLQTGLIAFNLHRLLRLDLQSKFLLVSKQSHVFNGGSDQLRKVKASNLKERFAGIQAGHAEQLIDDFGKSYRFLQHSPQHLSHISVDLGILNSCFKLSAHDRQRCAQLVRSVGREPADVVKRLFQSLDHAVQGNRKLLQFVASSGHRHSCMETARGYLLCPCSHNVERSQG